MEQQIVTIALHAVVKSAIYGTTLFLAAAGLIRYYFNVKGRAISALMSAPDVDGKGN